MNSGDQFETIVSEHYEPLFRFAMSLTRVDSDARDLTQQTFYVWATKGHQLRDRSKVKAWLFTTLHRAFLQARRKESRFTHHELEDVAEELPTVSPNWAALADSSQVLGALARVDEVYQASLALFYLQECSYKQIAVVLEVPIGTVKSRIARGIAQLRAILRSDGSPASSAGEDSLSFLPAADKPEASPVTRLPAPRRPRNLGGGVPEGTFVSAPA